MAAKRRDRDDFEDDGRVIADMSAVERPSLLGHVPARQGSEAREPRERRRPKMELTTKERVWLALGAMKAGLVVSLVFVVAIGVVIVALLLLWNGTAGA